MFDLWVVESFFLIFKFILCCRKSTKILTPTKLICYLKSNIFCIFKDNCYQLVFKSILTSHLRTQQLLEITLTNVI